MPTEPNCPTTGVRALANPAGGDKWEVQCPGCETFIPIYAYQLDAKATAIVPAHVAPVKVGHASPGINDQHFTGFVQLLDHFKVVGKPLERRMVEAGDGEALCENCARFEDMLRERIPDDALQGRRCYECGYEADQWPDCQVCEGEYGSGYLRQYFPCGHALCGFCGAAVAGTCPSEEHR